MDHLLSIGSVRGVGFEKLTYQYLKVGTVKPHPRASGSIFLSPGLACADGGGTGVRHQAGGENQ